MNSVHGFVYGHYDSRGGTYFIAAGSKTEADTYYNKNVFAEDEIFTEKEFHKFVKRAALELRLLTGKKVEAVKTTDTYFNRVFELRLAYPNTGIKMIKRVPGFVETVENYLDKQGVEYERHFDIATDKGTWYFTRGGIEMLLEEAMKGNATVPLSVLKKYVRH